MSGGFVGKCGDNDLVVLGWVDFHARNEGLADELDGVTRYVQWGPRGNPVVAVFRYAVQFAMTLAVLVRDRPRRVLCMVPPFPALMACVLYGRLSGAAVVGDVHTYPLVASTWRPFLPFTAWLLRRSRGAVVTNEANAAILRQRDVHTLVVDNAPDLRAGRDTQLAAGGQRIVVPASFDRDEPILEILHAARRHPDLHVVITGRDTTGVLTDVDTPPNVELTGFVSRSRYEELLAGADVVCALTTLDDCMQQAGYEAMSWGRPLVTSNTHELRSYFGEAARYAAPNATSIGEAWVDALAARDELHARMVGLGLSKAAGRPAEIAALRELLGLG